MAAHPLLELQRTAGNRATVDIAAERRTRPGGETGGHHAPLRVQRAVADLAKPFGAQLKKPGASSTPRTMTPLPAQQQTGALDDPKAEARLQTLALNKAKEVIGAVEPLERRITVELKKIAEKNNGHLVGLKHATKKVDSLHRKLADEARKRVLQGEAISRAVALEAQNTKDALRYTMTLDEGKYAQVADTELVSALAAVRATRIKAANAWAPPTDASTPHSYKGFNSAYEIEASNGVSVKFEVQLHTEASWAKKSELHGLYETARDEKASAAERAEANQKMADAWQSVPVPTGIGDYDAKMNKRRP